MLAIGDYGDRPSDTHAPAAVMNHTKLATPLGKVLYRALLRTSRIGPRVNCEAFGSQGDGVVERIYVINLDRQDVRWRQMRHELARLRPSGCGSLMNIVRRFSAIDARYSLDHPDDELHHDYSLGEQLFVDPLRLPRDGRDMASLRIQMSQQEAAVARSHTAVWKLIADGSPLYTLVLEDDVYFPRRFPRAFDKAWTELAHTTDEPAFDLLYLAYEEARAGADMTPVSGALVRPTRGVWQMSGYVLSRRGAQRLLKRLPVRGPVDLWLNHQFANLDVLALRKQVIRHRVDMPSSNSYSVLPILSKVGVLTRERPATIRINSLPSPLFAVGKPGTGTTALATALSMLGYRCCSDVDALPDSDFQALFRKQQGRVFDAYVNVGSLGTDELVELAKLYPRARFIVTSSAGRLVGPDGGDGAVASARRFTSGLDKGSDRTLVLPTEHRDKWQLLCSFLGLEYPSYRYPDSTDLGQRALVKECADTGLLPLPTTRQLQWDSSPWIVARSGWRGLALGSPSCELPSQPPISTRFERLESLNGTAWALRDDTFPSNLALFSPQNFAVMDGAARLTLREEHAVVRGFTSAALSSRMHFRYGRFMADLKPAKVPGLITGLFLHRNSPRQEIDIEFLGNDTTKLMVNVFYNPGCEQARLEYGYRGTPVLVDLGFDAAADFHEYEIEWTPTSIRWRVDGHVICHRVEWNPTPVPHLPMQFHFNLWHSRSTALAGKLARSMLPARAELRGIEVHA